MNNETDYIAASVMFNPNIILFAELATVISCIWLIVEAIKLFKFFYHHDDRLTKLLSFEFATKGLYALITLFMGWFLYFDFAEGVKFLVIIRPAFICLSAYALHRLYHFYKKEI